MTTEITYTPEQALNDLRDAVLRFGADTTYAVRVKNLTGKTWDSGVHGCRNKLNDEPACIVGVALAERFGASAVPPEGSATTTLSAMFGFYFSELEHGSSWFGTEHVLTNAQDVQDSGETWGNALSRAEEAYLSWKLES
jgi:hypothetical protein